MGAIVQTVSPSVYWLPKWTIMKWFMSSTTTSASTLKARASLSAPFRKHLPQWTEHLIYQRMDGSWPTPPLVFVQSQQESEEAVMNARCHQRGQTQKVDPELCGGNKENTPLKPGTRKKRHFFFSFFNGVQVFYIKKNKHSHNCTITSLNTSNKTKRNAPFFLPMTVMSPRGSLRPSLSSGH